MTTTTAPVRGNKYGGRCYGCHQWVEPQAGRIEKIAGAWAVHHVGDCPTPQARPGDRPDGQPAPVGIYRDPDGTIWLVKESRGQKDTPVAQRRRYAKKLIDSPARLTEGGDAVKYDWEIVRGAVYHLLDGWRVPLDDQQVRNMIIATGRCIVCEHGVWAEETMRRGRETGVLVGPVCAKSFGPARVAAMAQAA